SYTLTHSRFSAVPRRTFYQLAVILNDSHAPDVDFSFWLDSPYPNNLSYSDTMAATISITVRFGPELASDQAPGGLYQNVTHNTIGDWWFFANSTETPQTANPVFTTVAVTVTYTDNFDQNPRTIYRSLTFALKYSAPPAPVNAVWAAAAGLGAAGVLGRHRGAVAEQSAEETPDRGVGVRPVSRRYPRPVGRERGAPPAGGSHRGAIHPPSPPVPSELSPRIRIADIESASVIRVAPAWHDTSWAVTRSSGKSCASAMAPWARRASSDASWSTSSRTSTSRRSARK